MKAIIQTGYNKTQIKEMPSIPLSPISIKVKTNFVPLLRYDLLKINGQVPTKLPSILGYGATGTVVAIGNLRSSSLLNKRVLILNPWGTFQEKITSNIPPLTIPILDNVSNEEATGLIGGADLALSLFKIVKNTFKQIIIYGADSVTGLVLMQLLTRFTKVPFIPKARTLSANYLKQKINEYNIKPDIEATAQKNNLIIDLVGSDINDKLYQHIQNNDEVISVAQNDLLGVKFISKPALPKDYSFLMNEISNNRLFIPINQIFNYKNFNEAIEYQTTSPSRGRNLISFKD
ncbi:hypothetical protein [Lactobacillus sp. ESL0225]|uniref:hypothetical protein n=1 Tax=Lactobacillus sp. ESL0225 TaxID=2069351 RepID=UPI000EFA826B|nr:hypothetical protein [Lactobacillus sp. ESL0225]RMC47982.1 hypothetical protein F5ESL0225_06595 [Lactobacillus sp. ESL0225]